MEEKVRKLRDLLLQLERKRGQWGAGKTVAVWVWWRELDNARHYRQIQEGRNGVESIASA